MKEKNLWRKTWAAMLVLTMSTGLLPDADLPGQKTHGQGSASGEKVFYYGDTTFNTENDETDVDPHNGYSGWACIRYGIGETLFRYSDSMELEPWLLSGYENVDENTWRITLKVVYSLPAGEV